ncbi:hypothetical protein SmJEL517_g04453 [Synchytrium microbalum]|uniref:Uncharacterized protein n=1 Tax=Synchytrium microbalum TaxID=1806994 RepID=A0A507C305_9FUNG|nr:uncharacterized protein SmJEL517_g04453 [Synchytrium microbalum]TPX32464.1 hypothetical protein SmJEL517_g04453 [Synchytrium microbalum]
MASSSSAASSSSNPPQTSEQTELQNPAEVLEEAQACVARKDYQKATDKFTQLIDVAPPTANMALAYMSRSLCFWELKDYQSALDDAMKAHDCEDIITPNEILHGAFNSKAASAFQIAACCGKLGRGAAVVSKYQKIATDMLKVTAAAYEKANALKDEGNDYFKRGWLELALAKYEEGLKLDPLNVALMGNICQALLKMNRLDEAADIAHRCTETRPEWPKGWYRKGMVLMKKKHYSDAVSAFQTALSCPGASDDDAGVEDIKSAYMQAVTMAQKTEAARGGFDKQYMGIMMQMRSKSWNIYEWYSKSRMTAEMWNLRDWKEKCAANCQKDASLTELIDRAMATKFTMKKGSLPMDVFKWKEGSAPPRTAMAAFTIPITPLVSLVIMHYIISKSFPSHKWSMVWTFQAERSLFEGSMLAPHVSHHKTYAFLISKDSKIIIDIFGIWAYDAGGEDEPEKNWVDLLVEAGLKAGKPSERDKQSDDPKLRNQPWTFYTSDDRSEFLEFIEAGAKVERAEAEWVKVEQDEKKKAEDERKKKAEDARDAKRSADLKKMAEEARAVKAANAAANANNNSGDGSGENKESSPVSTFQAPFDVSTLPKKEGLSTNFYILAAIVGVVLAMLAYYMGLASPTTATPSSGDGTAA